MKKGCKEQKASCSIVAYSEIQYIKDSNTF